MPPKSQPEKSACATTISFTPTLYAHVLLRAVPRPVPRRRGVAPALEGDPPNPVNRPTGCHFHPRCPHAMPICAREYPALRAVAPGRTVACHLYQASVISSQPSA